ncbi:MAG: TonB-dependent receptor [Niabella sp.]
MKKTRFLSVLFCMLSTLCTLNTKAQTQSVSGTITDDKGSPVPNASVTVKSTGLGTTTDDSGKYTIGAKKGDVLEFSSIGYTTTTITIADAGTADVQLTPDISGLTNVVVIGYGTARKKDLTGSVSVVDMKELKQQPAASPIEALQGKATGVQIINDGAPGATPQIRIRGFSTINNNDPLYIVDGIPYEGKLSWLSSGDIESMQVLKDASAASIYGARANNGVVIITTKKGKKGPPKVSLDMYYGIQSPNRNRFPKFLNPQQYAAYVYQRFKNAGQTPGTSETTGANYGTDPDNPTLPEYLLAGAVYGQNITAADADPSKYNYVMDADEFYQITKANQAGTNWFKEITQNAPMQNYQLSVLGGGENSGYALSGSYFKQEGTYKYTGFERYTIRSNTSFTFLNDRVTIGENMQYSYTKGNGFGVNVNTSGSYQAEDSPIGWAYRIQTIIPVYDIMGNFAGTRGDKMGNADNPMAVLYRAKDNFNNSGQFFGSAFADIKLAKGFNFRSTYGVRYEAYNGRSIGYPNPERSEGSFTNNTLSEYAGNNAEWTWTNTLTYKNKFNSVHDLTLLAGTEAVESKWHQLSGSGNDFFITGDLNYYYLNTAATTSAGSEGTESALFSIFGRADYSYKEKYLLSATLRRDGSSNFGESNRFGLFPAASVAWRLSNEAFVKSADWINDLKFRAGYGVTGNQRIPTFQYLKRYASGIAQSFYPITGGSELASGLWTSNYDNLDVKWEEQKSVNIGLDFTILNNKIDGSIDWFNKKTDGVLYPVPQPSAAVGTGSSPYINSGNIVNKGIELSVNYHYIAPGGEDAFRFDVGAFFSKYSNKITQLAPSVTEQPYLTLRSVTTSVLKAGAPLGAFYGYKVIGIYQNEDDLSNSATYDGARVGGLKFADLSGADGSPDGVIDGNDRTVIGNPHPDFIYSLSLNASYKRFDISMFFNGSQGNELFDLTRQYTDFYIFPGAVSTRTLDAWSTSNPNSKIPSPGADMPTTEKQSSSYYVQDGSFFRMKNLQIGYTFPVDKMFKDRISNLRLYASVTNLFLITKYSGMDPEVSQYSSTFTAPGVDMGVYPVPRQFLLGLNVTF